MNFKGQYYGPNKIDNVVNLEDKTYFGKERIRLEFKDKNIELPLAMAEVAVSKEAKDLTGLVNLRIKPVVSRMLAILAEAELSIDEINYIMPDITESVNINIDKANKILWGKEKGEKTLLDVDKILLPEKYENCGIKCKGATRNRGTSK